MSEQNIQDLQNQIDSLKREVGILRTISKPDEGWSLTDFTARVSEVISGYQNYADLSRQIYTLRNLGEDIKSEIESTKSELQHYKDELAKAERAYKQFEQMADWWDTNGRIFNLVKDKVVVSSKIASHRHSMSDIEGIPSKVHEAKDNVSPNTLVVRDDFGHVKTAKPVSRDDAVSFASISSRSNSFVKQDNLSSKVNMVIWGPIVTIYSNGPTPAPIAETSVVPADFRPNENIYFSTTYGYGHVEAKTGKIILENSEPQEFSVTYVFNR